MKNKLEKMYSKLLDKSDANELKQINKLIELFKNDLEKELGFTFYETCATDMPNYNFDARDEKRIRNVSETVILRDKEGFYGIDENIQSKIEDHSIELGILHNLITRKEEIINKQINTNDKLLNDRVEMLRNKMEYGNVRKITLEMQARNKKVK